MPQYRVEMSIIDPEDETKDINYSTLVIADNEKDAIVKAKIKRTNERQDLPTINDWEISVYETGP